MGSYILKRIVISIFLVFLVSIFSMTLMHILPGDPARLAMGSEAAEEDVDALRAEMNLDKPLPTQYMLWIEGLFKGDMGESILFKRPNKIIFEERVPKTIAIGVPALLIAVPIAIVFGIICAIKRGKLIDQILTFLMTLGMGTPIFWVGILGIYIFAMWLKILPIQGFVSPFDNFGQYVYKAILPVACLSISLVAGVARQTRTNMLDSINQDYIRTARANGISENKIVFKYALKNALIPVVTIVGIQVRFVIGGSLLVEQVFNIAGLGTLLTTAVNNRDYLLVQNCVLLIAIFTVTINLIVDILYGVIDPRIRLSLR